ncbi:MAG: hypothetical protein FWD57_09015 [Polyangiaceae bacterium]|nr:hypothetical protein [Polyangiaceae bacterium]
MSEYQLFEFLALDRPLTSKEQDTLRKYSSRATITSRKFKVDYSWGSFKGNENEWMRKYFDAFLYQSAYESSCFMLRLPRSLLPIETAKQYSGIETRWTFASATDEHVILTFQVDTEEDHEWIDEDSDTLATLLPLRADIANGDLRALYIAWLASINREWDDDDFAEPPCPPGLGSLTRELEALAEFLGVDDDLLAAAATGSQALVDIDDTAFEAWVRDLPIEDKNVLVLRLVRDSPTLLRSELVQRFRMSCVTDHQRRAGNPRTAMEILTLAESLGKERRRRESEEAARAKARRDQEDAARLDQHLALLKPREKETWKEVDSLIATKKANNYDLAVLLLGQLAELCKRDGRIEQARSRILDIRDQHRGKRTFVDRLEKAGLIPENEGRGERWPNV